MSSKFHGLVNDVIILLKYAEESLQLSTKIKLCVWSKSKKQQNLDIGIDSIKKLISEYNLTELKCFSNLSCQLQNIFREVIFSQCLKRPAIGVCRSNV